MTATTRTAFRRCFSSSASTSSHIGSAPILVHSCIALSLPTPSISPDLSPASPLAQRIISVTGPLGAANVSLPPCIILRPPSAADPHLAVTVHDSTVKRQRSVWGTTRSYIHNAIKGVSTGFAVELRLVGVGYRAAVEPIPQIYRDMQQALPRKSPKANPGTPSSGILPTERLNLKLGFSHPVIIDIPPEIRVSVPTPTRIALSCNDKQKMGVFAATVRRWRKPEPYRGKGIFVGDETIKLKEVKKK